MLQGFGVRLPVGFYISYYPEDIKWLLILLTSVIIGSSLGVCLKALTGAQFFWDSTALLTAG